MDTPEWVSQTEELIHVVVDFVQANLQEIPHIQDAHLRMLPYCATLHWYSALESSIEINLRGHHAVAVCLIRQALEAQSIVALGLSQSEDSQHILQRWDSGLATHGEIRKHLEQQVWPHFHHVGLWNETWSEYYSIINRAVQEYSHYTHSLMGWQWRDVGPADEPQTRLAAIGIAAYDSVKASRITAFHAILTWTMGKILDGLMPSEANVPEELSERVIALQEALAACNLLWPKNQWEAQFAPHMFVPGDRSDLLLE